MLKQRVENKAAKRDEYVAPDGQVIRRSDLSDDGELVKLGLQLTPFMWAACAVFGLRSESGKTIGFISPSHDPREPRREEVPVNLLRVAEEAQAALDAHVARRAAADESERFALFVQDAAFSQRLAAAERNIKEWIDDERLYRHGHAERPQPLIF